MLLVYYSVLIQLIIYDLKPKWLSAVKRKGHSNAFSASKYTIINSGLCVLDELL